MKPLLLALPLVFSVSALHAKTLTTGIDRSDKNLVLIDQDFADAAASFTASHVNTLKHGDVVRIKNFGDRGNEENIKTIAFKIDRKNKPHVAAKKVGKYIQSIPKSSPKGQRSTNIIAFFELSTGLDCASGSTVLLITDGLEASEYISAKAFQNGSKTLPKPDVDLKGCEVIFYGLGRGWKPKAVKTVLKGWQTYFKAAGASFTAITD